MTDLADNPIYNRMVQDSKGPSERTMMLAGLGIAIIGNALGYLDQGSPLRLPDALESVVKGVWTIIIMLAFLQPVLFAAAAILTARLVSRHISSEDFALVQISGLTGEDIVRGYSAGARYRFRAWVWIGLGLIASYFYTAAQSTVGFVLLSLALTVVYFVLWPVLIMIGVWAAARSPRFPLPIVFGLGIAFLVYSCLSLVAVVWVNNNVFQTYAPQMGSEYNADAQLVPVRGYSYPELAAGVVMGLVLPYLALRLLQGDCVRMVSKREL